MRCHQGCKGPFPFAFLSQKRRKTVRELVWVVWEVGKGSGTGRKRESATTLVVITRPSLGSMAALMFI